MHRVGAKTARQCLTRSNLREVGATSLHPPDPSRGAILKTTVLTPVSSARLESLSAGDSDILLDNARLLQRAVEPRQTLLRGKKLALLCESEEGADATLFRN